ncbi:MAG: hypothetical protein ACEY3F_03215, partial [Wolbachia sp.]
MTELTDIQQKIRTSLIAAIQQDNPQEVQTIFNNKEYDDIQESRPGKLPSWPLAEPYVRLASHKAPTSHCPNP